MQPYFVQNVVGYRELERGERLERGRDKRKFGLLSAMVGIKLSAQFQFRILTTAQIFLPTGSPLLCFTFYIFCLESAMEREVASEPQFDHNEALVQVWEPDVVARRSAPALTAIADLHESHQRFEHLRVIVCAVSNGPGNSQRLFATD